MRFVCTAVALLSLGSKACAQIPLLRDTTLANGLQVIVLENHSVPLVSVEFDVKNGAFTQTPEYEGLAHLYEHMFFKGNRTIPSQERYTQRLRELGGVWNGSTSEERVNYYVTVGTDSARPALRFMDDAVRYPLFDEQELVRERPVVICEFDRNEASPNFQLWRSAERLLWSPAYFSRKNTIGDRAIILGATRAKMQDIQHRYYVPNNTLLILAGDITPAAGFRMAAEELSDWPRAEDPFATPVPDPPPLTKSQAVIETQPVSSVTIMIKLQGPSVVKDAASTYAADVLSAVVANRSSGFSKRLIDSGIAYQANFNYYTINHVGPITFSLQTSPEKVQEARRAALEELSRMTDSTYVTAQELSDAQKQLGTQLLYQQEETTEFAHSIGIFWAEAGLEYFRSYVPNMQRVTRGDLARYARRYLADKPYVIGVMMSSDMQKQSGLTAESLLPREQTP